MNISYEKPEDVDLIRKVNLAAFGQAAEAELVDKLRSHCKDFVSLVAKEDHRIVGHILFTPVEIKTKQGVVEGMGLAPMAVLPEYQKMGVGTQLIEKGIEEIKNKNCPFVVVLGHPEYYPKFGFEPASKYGIRCKWEVPEEAFMIMKLKDVELSDFEGLLSYRPEFDEV